MVTLKVVTQWIDERKMWSIINIDYLALNL